ncbi:MAG: substrate-binding domain-containing protein, partial [Actinomycetota bacterium]|nr:substrate-binding domain-containing protein [Actinomycetota bacterium]
MRKVLAAVLAVVFAAGCTSDAGESPSGPPVTLRVLAGSELRDMEPLLTDAAAATGVTVEMSYLGTLDGAETVASGKADGHYDALWFSSTRYLQTIPEAKKRLASTNRIMGSPVVLGVREPVAQRLGWDAKAPTWSHIAAAAENGQFSFGMTDPAASNTGFSALVAVAAALDGTGRALDAAAIDRI